MKLVSNVPFKLIMGASQPLLGVNAAGKVGRSVRAELGC